MYVHMRFYSRIVVNGCNNNQMYKTELHTHILCVVNKSKFIIMNANNNLSINTTQAAN